MPDRGRTTFAGGAGTALGFLVAQAVPPGTALPSELEHRTYDQEAATPTDDPWKLDCGRMVPIAIAGSSYFLECQRLDQAPELYVWVNPNPPTP